MDGMGDAPDGMGYDMPMLMNQQPNLFGAYAHEGSPMLAGLSNPSYENEPTMGANEDNNDAKRRRIARVSGCGGIMPLDRRTGKTTNSCSTRLAICVGRRRSSATGKCPNARIV